jgi:putative endonuclease
MKDFVRKSEVLFCFVNLPCSLRLHGYASVNPCTHIKTHPAMNFHYVYVLFSERDKKLYIGFSDDVYRRLEEHNAGKNISTSNRTPLQLIYFEAHILKEDALRREAYFKTTAGKRTLRIVLKNTLVKLGYKG